MFLGVGSSYIFKCRSQRWDNLVQVAKDTVVTIFEYPSFRVVVDGNHYLGVANAGCMLRLPGNTHGNVEIGRDLVVRRAYDAVRGKLAHIVADRQRAGYFSVHGICQFLNKLQILFGLETHTHAHNAGGSQHSGAF